MKTHKKSFPFPSGWLDIFVLLLVPFGLTVGLTIAFPIDNLNLFDQPADNQSISDLLIFIPLFVFFLLVTYLANRIRKTSLQIFSNNCVFDWKTLLFALGGTLIVLFALIHPFESLVWGVPSKAKVYSWSRLLSVIIISPLLEEILFRGVILNGLSYKHSSIYSILVAAILFSAFHMDYHKLFSSFIVGLIWGVLYIKTNKNLIFCIICHAFANACSFFGAFDLDLYQHKACNIILLAISIGLIGFFILRLKQKACCFDQIRYLDLTGKSESSCGRD